MQVVILAGGFGTRISEESQYKPKPMIEIGGMPIIIHIMKWYAKYGYNDFIICAGYKQEKIKEYFSNFAINTAKSVTFPAYGDNSKSAMDTFSRFGYNPKLEGVDHIFEKFNIQVVDTGVGTLTGGRLKQIAPYINGDRFLMTYGDGLCDVDINKLYEQHINSNAKVTLTGILPESRYGTLELNEANQVLSFREKSKMDSNWINGGFMVIEKSSLDYIEGDVMFEHEPLQKLFTDGNLYCYKHSGNWACMDTLRDKERLDAEWATGKAFWSYDYE